MNTLACYNSSGDYIKDWGGHKWYEDETCLNPSVGYVIDTDEVKYYKKRPWLDVPSNLLWYKSKDNQIIDPANSSGFLGVDGLPLNIVSHEYDDALGLNVITLSGDLYTLGQDLFYYGRLVYLNFYEIYMPNTVKTIEMRAFRGCGWGRDYKGVYVLFSNTLEKLCEDCFCDCNLTDVYLPDSVHTIVYLTFEYTTIDRIRLPHNPNLLIGEEGLAVIYGLQYLDIPEGTVSLGMESMALCQNLKSVTFPSSLKSVGEYTLGKCPQLEEVTFLDSEVDIPELFCYQNAALKKVNLGTKIKKIGNHAFRECPGLEQIVIPNSTTEIALSVFYGCNNLSEITFPETCLIGRYAVGETKWLANLPDGLIYISGTLYTYKGTMPANTSIIVQDGTKYISGEAFVYQSNLQSIYIPQSCTKILEYAFYGCTSLTDITFGGTMEQWNSIFKGQSWKYNIKALAVHCSDGDVAL